LNSHASEEALAFFPPKVFLLETYIFFFLKRKGGSRRAR